MPQRKIPFFSDFSFMTYLKNNIEMKSHMSSIRFLTPSNHYIPEITLCVFQTIMSQM